MVKKFTARLSNGKEVGYMVGYKYIKTRILVDEVQNLYLRSHCVMLLDKNILRGRHTDNVPRYSHDTFSRVV